jgi:hypothetical protein
MTAEYTTPQPGTHALAIVSLVLSLLGLVQILPLIGGIVSGMIARNEIRDNPNRYSGEGIARTAIILGWVGIALSVLVALCALAFLLPVATNIQVFPSQ